MNTHPRHNRPIDLLVGTTDNLYADRQRGALRDSPFFHAGLRYVRFFSAGAIFAAAGLALLPGRNVSPAIDFAFTSAVGFAVAYSVSFFWKEDRRRK